MQAGKSIVPDLQIFVSEEAGDPRTLSFRASAADPRLGFGTFVDYGQTTLRVDPDRYLDGLFAQLQMAGGDVDARLENAGVRLFEDLLPFELRRRLWQARHAIGSLFVVTAEAWIPWELLKLQDPEGNDIGPFFAEAFAMGRWLSSSGQRSSAALHLPLRRLGLIFPADSGLPQAQFEKRDLLTHAGENRQVVEIEAERTKIAAAMAEGTFDGWHFCGHGQISRGEIEPGYLQIEADSFDANQLYGRARSLGRHHPLVFLNACYGGRAGEGLAGLSGLPVSFLQVGAGAFIGPLWQVSDTGAALFARVFYRSFLGGATLGAAVLEARQALRQDNRDDPTWLAYIVLGHPSAVCAAANPSISVPSELSTGDPLPSTLKRPMATIGEAKRGGSREPMRRSPKSRLRLAMVLGAAVAASSVAAASIWRVPTTVRLEGRVSRLSAVAGSAGPVLLEDALAFRRLTAAQLAAAEVVDASGQAAPLDLQGGAHPRVITAAAMGFGAGTLSRLELSPGSPFSLEAEKIGGELALRIEGMPAFSPYEALLPSLADLSSPQASLAPAQEEIFHSGQLRIFPIRQGLVLEIEIPTGAQSKSRIRLTGRPIDIESLTFTEQRSSDGTLRSTIRSLKISYPQSPARGSLDLGGDGAVEVGLEDRFRVRLLELDRENGDLVLALEGRAERIHGGVVGDVHDLRSSLLEARPSQVLFASLLASLASALAAAGYFRGAHEPGVSSSGSAQRKVEKLACWPMIVLAVAFAAGTLEGQPSSVSYQDRGDRFEGSHSHPVGGHSIELLGAMSGTVPGDVLPETMALSFYLREQAEIQIVVRELVPRKNYWLDQVRPSPSWAPRSWNRFLWPAETALRPLGLEPSQLVALVRLGYSSSRVTEMVAPVHLGSAALAAERRPFRFVFITSRPAKLEVRLAGCAGQAEPMQIEAPRRIPFEISVRTAHGSATQCRLELDGHTRGEAARIFQAVEFYADEEGVEE